MVPGKERAAAGMTLSQRSGSPWWTALAPGEAAPVGFLETGFLPRRQDACFHSLFRDYQGVLPGSRRSGWAEGLRAPLSGHGGRRLLWDRPGRPARTRTVGLAQTSGELAGPGGTPLPA